MPQEAGALPEALWQAAQGVAQAAPPRARPPRMPGVMGGGETPWGKCLNSRKRRITS
jgi:hypothetical protein